MKKSGVALVIQASKKGPEVQGPKNLRTQFTPMALEPMMHVPCCCRETIRHRSIEPAYAWLAVADFVLN